MKKNVKLIILYAVLLAVVVFIAWSALKNSKVADDVVYSDLVELFNNDEVKSFEVTEENVVKIIKQDGSAVSYKLRDFSVFYYDFSELINEKVKEGKIESYEYEPITSTPWWLSILPTVIMIIVIAIIWIWITNQMMGGKGSKINSFGRSRARLASDDKNAKRVYFSDVAGADEEKAELAEVVDYLKSPAKYVRLGAKIPHGILLVGPPGTGKTLLAKAVAGEAGVPFYALSGSDFVEMYVGVGASRVRDLFDTAKKNPASIIFIDEIDAVGRHRGAGLGGGHDEREQTLNQLLVEMDGFGSTDGVIVIAATNRVDILDPALLRPGRFDRRITVNYPDIKGREDILKVHARGKPFEAYVDFHKIAQTTVGFTGADLANLLNEASLLAARRNKTLIGMDEIEDSYMKMILGPKKKAKIRRPEDIKLTAYHESGHAVAAYFCKGADPVRHISIIPSGNAGGVTVMIPEQDVDFISKNDMFDRIVVDLGGRVAEELVLDDISTGASNDISQATNMARNMVTRYGMSDKLGPVLYGSEHSQDEIFLGRDFSSGKSYSENTASLIDSEVKDIITRAYTACRNILTEHIDNLKTVAEYLIHAETCDGDQLEAIINGETDFAVLDGIVEEKKRKSREENEMKRRKMQEDAQNNVNSEDNLFEGEQHD